MKSKGNVRLETAIKELIGSVTEGCRFDVIAHELWRNSDSSLSLNDSWVMTHAADLDDAIESVRSRWEMFKISYYPKARIKDIADIYDGEDMIMLEVNYVPFVNIRIHRP